MHFAPKTQPELERNFVEAFERLARANAGYDEGRLSEAPNITKEIYNLIDKKKPRSHSLLEILGLGSIEYISSAAPQTPGNLAPEYRLIHATISFDGMDYRPFLNKTGFTTGMRLKTWKSEIVLAWEGREGISRGELLEFIRHVEGGGHIAPQYEQRWSGKMLALMRGSFINGHMVLGDGPLVAPENPHAPAYATARQIGWEMEETLRRSCAELVARAETSPRPGPRMRPIRS